MKNNEGCHWKKNLFDLSANLEDPELWKPILDKYIDDIITIALHDLSLRGDTFNYVVIKQNIKEEEKYIKEEEKYIKQEKYIIRPFCFDFSAKHYGRKLEKTCKDKIDSYNFERLISNLSGCIANFVYFEKGFRDYGSKGIYSYNSYYFDGLPIAWSLLPVFVEKLNKRGIAYELPLTEEEKEQERVRRRKESEELQARYQESIAQHEKFEEEWKIRQKEHEELFAKLEATIKDRENETEITKTDVVHIECDSTSVVHFRPGVILICMAGIVTGVALCSKYIADIFQKG